MKNDGFVRSTEPTNEGYTVTYFSLVDSTTWLVIVGLVIDVTACVLASQLIGFGLRSTYCGLLAVMALTIFTGGVMAFFGSFQDPWASILILYFVFNVVVGAPILLLDRQRHPQYYHDLEHLSLFNNTPSGR